MPVPRGDDEVTVSDRFELWPDGRTRLRRDTGADRRREDRLACDALGALLGAGADAPVQESLTVEVRDLSWHGLGLIVPAALPVGSRWRLLLVRGTGVSGQQRLTVRHCRALDGGRYLVGCEFSACELRVDLGALERAAPPTRMF